MAGRCEGQGRIPEDVLVLRGALCGGARVGLATVGGMAAGWLAWGIAAAVGLAEVVARSAPVYEGVRLAGAAYLVLLGLVPLLAEARRRSRSVSACAPDGPTAQTRLSAGRAFAAGLVSDVLDPTIGMFYLAVVPQFVPSGAPALQYSLRLCAVDVAVAVGWLAWLVWVAHAAVRWLRRPAVVRWTQRIFDTCLIGVGASAAAGS